MAKDKKEAEPRMYTPAEVLVRTTGCSPTLARIRCDMNPQFSELPKLYAQADAAGIRKLLASEKVGPSTAVGKAANQS